MPGSIKSQTGDKLTFYPPGRGLVLGLTLSKISDAGSYCLQSTCEASSLLRVRRVREESFFEALEPQNGGFDVRRRLVWKIRMKHFADPDGLG